MAFANFDDQRPDIRFLETRVTNGSNGGSSLCSPRHTPLLTHTSTVGEPSPVIRQLHTVSNPSIILDRYRYKTP